MSPTVPAPATSAAAGRAAASSPDTAGPDIAGRDTAAGRSAAPSTVLDPEAGENSGGTVAVGPGTPSPGGPRRRFLSPRTTPPAGRRRPTRWGVVAASAAALFFAVALVWPAALSPRDPLALDLTAALQAPGLAHWFGTDEAGRDLFARVVWGTRDSLAIGFGATLVSMTTALVLGSLAALAPRWLAGAVDRLIEVLLAFPTLLLALLLVAVIGPSAVSSMIAVGIGTAPGYARMIRGQVLSVRRSGYVEAAVALGHPRRSVLARHVVPNAVRPLVAVVALSIGQSIVWASSLSFLGLGVAPPSSEWGALLEAGRTYVTHGWWLTVIPGLVIAALALTTTTLGKALQDSLERGER